FQSAVAGFEDELTSNDRRDTGERTPVAQPPKPVVRQPEAPRAAASTEPSIFRKPEEPAQPAPERTSLFDSLFKRRERAPVGEPVESTWPVYQPDAEPAEETPAPAADPDTDWAPPADQAIGVDLPPADEEQPAFAAAEPATVEQPDPAEEAVWAGHESDAEATWPEPAK